MAINLSELLENKELIRNEFLQFRRHKDYDNLWIPLGDVITIGEPNKPEMSYVIVDKYGFGEKDYPNS